MGRGSGYAQGDGPGMSEQGDGPNTRLVSGGRRKEWTAGLVNPPVHRASTILFDSVADLRAKSGKPRQLHYGRQGTPSIWSLEEALTGLEPGAAGTKLFPSGVAAITTALMAVLGPGDTLLMTDSVYAPTRHFCDDVLARLGVTTIYYDPIDGETLDRLMDAGAKAVFLESPGSLTMEVQDVPGIAARARERGTISLIDNTWATPLLFPAIGHGVDLSILACTKYVVGHSDAMMGSVTASPGTWDRL